MRRPLLDNLAVALGAAVGLTFLAVATVLNAADTVYNWAASRFAIPPRSSKP